MCVTVFIDKATDTNLKVLLVTLCLFIAILGFILKQKLAWLWLFNAGIWYLNLMVSQSNTCD